MNIDLKEVEKRIRALPLFGCYEVNPTLCWIRVPSGLVRECSEPNGTPFNRVTSQAFVPVVDDWFADYARAPYMEAATNE
jgi:hypothetical protein